MSLFDARFPADAGQGGLLGRIPEWMLQAGPSQGFTGAAIPPNATPAAGMLPALMQQPAQQPAPQPQQGPLDGIGGLIGNIFGGGQQAFPPSAQPGIGDRLSAGLQSFTHSDSPLSAIGNLVQGLSTGQRTDPMGMALQQQRATFQALVGSGLPPNTAMAAALNPEILKTVAPAYFDTAPKLTETGTDPFTGQKTFGEYRPGRGLTPIGGAPAAGGAAPASNAFGEAVKSGVTGEDLYQHLPPQVANTVRAMIEGRMAPPSTIAMRSPQTMALINAANAIDPTFDAAAWGQRAASAKDFGSGKSSEMVRSANQTMHHVGKLLDSMEALNNTQYPLLNAPANVFNSTIMGKGQVGAFETNAHAVAEEMSKVFKGNNMSDTEIRAWEHNLSPNMSPEQQRAQVGKLMELLHGSLSALEEKRLNGMGAMAAAKAGPLLKDDAQKVLQRVDQWVKTNGQPQTQASPDKAATAISEGATATNPKTGQKIMFKGGQWVPAQ